MVIEQSINCGCGTLGGLTGLQTNVSAMERWFLTTHLKANVATATKAMLGKGVDHPAIPYKESTVSRIEKDEICIENIIEVVEKRMDSLFIVESEWDSENRKPLVNIRTGLVAPPDVCSWLNGCKQSGSIKLKDFLKKSIQTQTEDLCDPITKTKIKCFSSCYQKAAISKPGKLVATDIDRQIMGRLVVVSQTREVDLETLFDYELSSFPLSLFNPDGTTRKCCKSNLLKELERDLAVDELEETDETTLTFIDFMVLVRTICLMDYSKQSQVCSNMARMSMLSVIAMTSKIPLKALKEFDGGKCECRRSNFSVKVHQYLNK